MNTSNVTWQQCRVSIGIKAVFMVCQRSDGVLLWPSGRDAELTVVSFGRRKRLDERRDPLRPRWCRENYRKQDPNT